MATMEAVVQTILSDPPLAPAALLKKLRTMEKTVAASPHRIDQVGGDGGRNFLGDFALAAREWGCAHASLCCRRWSL